MTYKLPSYGAAKHRECVSGLRANWSNRSLNWGRRLVFGSCGSGFLSCLTDAYPQKRELKLVIKKVGGFRGLARRIPAPRPFGLRCAHRQFVLPMDGQVSRSAGTCRSGAPGSGDDRRYGPINAPA